MKEQFKKLHIEARKTKETVQKAAYESVLTAIQLKEIELQRELTSTEVVPIVQKVIKQYEETASFAEKDGRDNADELASASLLQELLPRQLTDEEVRVAIRDYVEVNDVAFTKASTGIVVKAIVENYQGKTDGKTVSRIFNELL